MNRPDPLPVWIQNGINDGWIGVYEKELLFFLTSEYGKLPEGVAAAILFVSLFAGAGHTCLPVDKSKDDWLLLLDLEEATVPEHLSTDPDSLLKHPAIGTEHQVTPFLLEEARLFIRKYHAEETAVAGYLNRMASTFFDDGNREESTRFLGDLFGDSPDEKTDWQKSAAALALRNQLLIISGGPGTGKTTTVARIIRLLQSLSHKPLRIALAAPTGKAAAKMSQSIEDYMCGSSGKKDLNEHMPDEAMTIHRLLRDTQENGLLPPPYRKLLPYDLIIIDEASMVDLSMTARLLRHTGENTRLVLLGDKNQLSSVEAGSVLGDICQKKENSFNRKTAGYLSSCGAGAAEIPVSARQQGLDDAIVYLTESYRFGFESGIAVLADAVNSGEEDAVSRILTSDSYPDLSFQEFSYGKEDLATLFDACATSLENGSGLTGAGLLHYRNREIWLGALRRGGFGTESLNRRIEEYLLKRRLIRPAGGWYHGRPVLVTRNDYSLGIYNGDLGVCVRSGPGSFCVLFSGAKGEGKKVAAHRLRNYEPAYLITVHKSQGSEFDEVNLLLPEQDTPVLTRELIYTAVTRASKRFAVYGNRDLFKKAAGRKTVRFTGLCAKLYGNS
ncbi:MAG: exodeoxyribonuclease V subunit alpha [Balneolaceae bacterium]